MCPDFQVSISKYPVSLVCLGIKCVLVLCFSIVSWYLVCPGI